ncbi:O-antigen polymerase [Clavibacter tessellarius]|uniref:O-antigen polymerase n=1 Tax=Clavibacter tessellarius TaxID=31965 RepID=UPI003256928E
MGPTYRLATPAVFAAAVVLTVLAALGGVALLGNELSYPFMIAVLAILLVGVLVKETVSNGDPITPGGIVAFTGLLLFVLRPLTVANSMETSPGAIADTRFFSPTLQLAASLRPHRGADLLLGVLRRLLLHGGPRGSPHRPRRRGRQVPAGQRARGRPRLRRSGHAGALAARLQHVGLAGHRGDLLGRGPRPPRVPGALLRRHPGVHDGPRQPERLPLRQVVHRPLVHPRADRDRLQRARAPPEGPRGLELGEPGRRAGARGVRRVRWRPRAAHHRRVPAVPDPQAGRAEAVPLPHHRPHRRRDRGGRDGLLDRHPRVHVRQRPLARPPHAGPDRRAPRPPHQRHRDPPVRRAHPPQRGRVAARLRLPVGATYAAVPAWFVPRGLWEDKPFGGGNTWFTSTYVPRFYGVNRVETSLSAIGEAFSNFGIPGVVAVGALLGLVAGLFIRARMRRRGVLGGAIAVVVTPYLFSLIRGDAYQGMSTSIASLVILVLFFWFSTTRKQVTGPVSAPEPLPDETASAAERERALVGAGVAAGAGVAEPRPAVGNGRAFPAGRPAVTWDRDR